jgi:hypothetical protein
MCADSSPSHGPSHIRSYRWSPVLLGPNAMLGIHNLRDGVDGAQGTLMKILHLNKGEIYVSAVRDQVPVGDNAVHGILQITLHLLFQQRSPTAVKTAEQGDNFSVLGLLKYSNSLLT